MKPRSSGSGRRRSDRYSLTIFALACVLLAQSGAVRAHALVIESQPLVNSTIDGNELVVDLKFNSRIDRKRARLQLIAPSGESRELTLTDDDSPDHLRAHSSALTPGDYRIEWFVLSPDGHVTRGNLPFHVTTPQGAVP